MMNLEKEQNNYASENIANIYNIQSPIIELAESEEYGDLRSFIEEMDEFLEKIIELSGHIHSFRYRDSGSIV